MDWFSEHAWQVWLGAAFVLGVLELFSLDLVLLMLATGALVGMILALLSLPVAVQIIGAVAAAVAALWLVRPSVVRKIHAGPTLKHGAQALVGSTGFVVEEVSARGGLVKLAGEVWTARPYDEHVVIPQGAKIEVFEIRGATAYVAQVAELET